MLYGGGIPQSVDNERDRVGGALARTVQNGHSASVRAAHQPRLSRWKSAQDADSESSGCIPHTVQHQRETPSPPVRLEECPSATVFHDDPASSASDNRDNTKAPVLPRFGRSAAAQGGTHVCHTASLVFVRVASGGASVLLLRTCRLALRCLLELLNLPTESFVLFSSLSMRRSR